MISSFPNFNKLDLSHKHQIENLINSFPPYSDYNFTSLWTYNTNNSIEISVLHNNLVVKFEDYITSEPFYSFLGVTYLKDTIDKLIKHAENKKIITKLKLIPEIVIKSDESLNNNYTIEQDRDNFDYIISTIDLANLTETKYKNKQYDVDHFKKNYPDYLVQFIDLKNPEEQNQVLELFKLWEKQTNKNEDETNIEYHAIKKLIETIEFLKIFTLGIYYSNKLIAFNIYEITHQNYGISAFQKADRNYRGIFTMINYEVARHLTSLNCKFINYEQDLGIAGLRNSKLAYHPVEFLKKYTVSAK